MRTIGIYFAKQRKKVQLIDSKKIPMKIFKFGGASIKDAEGFKNVADIIKAHQNETLLVVISAIGKTTNALESVIKHCYAKNNQVHHAYQTIVDDHNKIAETLFESGHLSIKNALETLYLELEDCIQSSHSQKDYDALYDQIIVYGELLASTIMSHYLDTRSIKNRWIDARDYIITDGRYRDARIQWAETAEQIKTTLGPIAEKDLVITQGFIGRSMGGESTTLGREGSDYSAAIFGSLLDADSISIWKDVLGVMSADPNKFSKAELIKELSYNDAIELAYYGASVIHPKTIQPLKARGIPLYVRSFIDINEPGTKVSSQSKPITISCKIHKDNQILLEISTRDFTFIAEDHLKQIFQLLSENNMRCNLMQNSAICFRCVLDSKENQHLTLIQQLESLGLDAICQSNLELLSIYNTRGLFDKQEEIGNKEIVLQQNMGKSIHYLVKERQSVQK